MQLNSISARLSNRQYTGTNSGMNFGAFYTISLENILLPVKIPELIHLRQQLIPSSDWTIQSLPAKKLDYILEGVNSPPNLFSLDYVPPQFQYITDL